MLQSARLNASLLALLLPLTAGGETIFSDLPPIRTWGETGYDFRQEDFKGGEHIGRLRLNAASYIYEPWVAQVDGTLNFNLRDSQFDSSKSSGNVIDGRGRLRLFPQSHFPFETYLERSDSSTTTDFLGLDLETLRFGAEQRYASQRLGAMRLRYEKLDQTQTTQDERDPLDITLKDDTDKIEFAYNRNVGKHQFFADNQLTFTERNSDRADSERMFTSVRHNFRPDSTLSFESRVTRNSNEQKRTDSLFDFTTTELNTYAFWRPRTQKRLVINGTLRAIRFDTQTDERSATSDTITLNGGTLYEYSPNLRYSSNSAFSHTRAASGDSFSASSRIGADYTSDNISFRGFDYGWAAGVDGSTFASDESSVQTLSGSVGHNLSRTFRLFDKSTLRVNGLESVTVLGDTDSRRTQRLLHNLTSTWSTIDADRTFLVSLNASDSRAFGGGGAQGDEQSSFQLVNLQSSVDQRLGRGSSLNGSLTVQTTRSMSPKGTGQLSQFDDGWRPSASANFTYMHPELFGFPRLRLRSTLQLISDSYLPLLDEPTGASSREKTSWENRLEYRIGLLDLRLVTRYVTSQREDRFLVLFQLRRFFGSR